VSESGSARQDPGEARLRLVLDTNVWLDWLVFDDPSVAPLRAAVEAGHAEVIIDDACEEELARVLAYPRRGRTLDAAAQADRITRCRAVVRRSEAVSGTTAETDAKPLPRCRDPHDQKFLQLAQSCGADFLVTRDRELLVLARRLPFGVITAAALPLKGSA
jgi:putative PIN family toxin of toxin-antitoxin system